jgi:uncharacterized protein YukE
MATIPDDYDSSSISVDPVDLGAKAGQIDTSTQQIADALSDIMDSLDALKLSWTGDSSKVADSFNSRWSDAMTELYGTKDDPGKGILNVLVGGLKAAVQNYSKGENQVVDMFGDFTKKLKGYLTPDDIVRLEWEHESMGDLHKPQDSLDDANGDGTFNQDDVNSPFQVTSVNEDLNQ